ncbi:MULTISPECIES: DUF2267 domain-containing protein [Streptomyces]|uniref:DUF2267 domain-containing protein n=1 Tax=Streptomyces chilikensis TaxID=1194079 RepID=A0ABV3EI09_9ACTN|nr:MULTISPECIES: DUF2267 domain-containing protein [Streptomyces]MDH6228464.1 uncharacterized protein (DUF2267 family) [Streptomyces sp. MJP52]
MDHATFIGQVQARARLDSRGAAEGATRATLETLAERVPATVANDVAGQLPREIGEHLRRVAAAPDQPATGVRLRYPEFLDRVARRAHEDPARAADEARCVMEVVGEATQGGVMEKIRHSVDRELGDFLLSGSTGRRA